MDASPAANGRAAQQNGFMGRISISRFESGEGGEVIHVRLFRCNREDESTVASFMSPSVPRAGEYIDIANAKWVVVSVEWCADCRDTPTLASAVLNYIDLRVAYVDSDRYSGEREWERECVEKATP